MIKTNLLNALMMIKEDNTFNAMLNWIDYMCVCVCVSMEWMCQQLQLLASKSFPISQI